MTKIRYAGRTEDELRNRELEATAAGVWSTTLLAIYETDPELVASVLPPPLEAPDEPLVRVTIASVDMGRPGVPVFGACTFAVMAKHEGTEADYALVMPMSTEQSVIGGRETFGEPKKIGDITLERDGARVVGKVTRLGTTFIEVAGTVGDTLPNPPDGRRTSFYFKFLPSPGGKGFDAEPSLVYCYRDETTRTHAAVDGEVILRESRFDPVYELPVRKLRSITVSEKKSIQTAEIHSTVPSDALLPFVHQRYDDLSPVGEE